MIDQLIDRYPIDTFRWRRIRSASSSQGTDCGIRRADDRTGHRADTAFSPRCMMGGSRRLWRHLTGPPLRRLPLHRRRPACPSATAAADAVPARTRCYGYLE